ncbi:MAG: hypothetical protein ACOY3P_18570, partial [Planctomycetota bacterium]
ERPWEERLTGALERTMELAPGASVGTLCLVSWHFPNLHGLPEASGSGTTPRVSPMPLPWPITWRRKQIG